MTVAALLHALPAQTPISGALSGTLPAGVYHTTGHVSVAAGQTLVLGPGVIVKLDAHQFTVDGTLRCNGTAGNPVIFTHLQDDSAGGDTNGNGPSSGSPGGWFGIVFTDTADASSLAHTEVRFGGYNWVPNVVLDHCDAAFDHCVVRHCYTSGMDLHGNSRPQVTHSSFTGNGGYAVQGVPFAALAGFADNTATGNVGNYVMTSDGSVAADLTLGPAAMLGGAIVVSSHILVAADATLTVEAGTIVKFVNGIFFQVAGTLRVQGTASNPCVFTALADDSAGGDTNGNGPSTGVPGTWAGIQLLPTADDSSLVYAEMRYCGFNWIPNIELDHCDAAFDHCTARNGYAHGMDLHGNSHPAVKHCTFVGNGGNAAQNVPLAALAGFTDNVATGNGGNYLMTSDGTVAADLLLGPDAMVGGAIVVGNHIAIAPGATLTVEAGTIFKFVSGIFFQVAGTLRTQGTASNPCVFTALADDSAGGDTDGNGPSTGVPGTWAGIQLLDTADASSLAFTEVRYGGFNWVPNVQLDQCDAAFDHCTVRDGYTHGMDLRGNSRPTIAHCTFTNNGGTAVQGVPIDAVPGCCDNVATGNGANFLYITTADVTGVLRIGPQSVLNGGLVLATNLTVAANALLILEQGVLFKFAVPAAVLVQGSVLFLGTSYEPVVFTSLADDQYGGDTNGNGPSTGVPASWAGISLAATATQSVLENVVVRHGGYNYLPGLACQSPLVSLRAVRVDRCYAQGFELGDLAGHAVDLVAWACGSDGIHLAGGSYHLLHATSAGNATGIRRDGPWTGTVINSISWNNQVNFANFTGSEVLASDGIAGGTGNLDVDPRFLDPTNGDLHLDATSPCLGAADLAYGIAAVKDHDENSRVTDHLLNGMALPDMGAFERQVWSMTVAGTPRPGSTITFQLDGPPGWSFWCWGVLDGTLMVPPWGMVLVGMPGQSVLLLLPFLVPTGTPLPLPLVADPTLLGAIAGFQTLTFPPSSTTSGNLTRLYRGLVRP